MPRRPDTDSDVPSRQRLILAACALMQERSSIVFSFPELSERAELNHGLVRYHFGTKDHLLLAVLKTVTGDSMGELDRLVALPVSPVRKMEIHIRGVVRAFGEYPFMNPLVRYLQSRPDSTFAQEVTASMTQPLVRAQGAMLNEGAEKGYFRPIDPMFFYCHLIGACELLFTSRETLRHGFGIAQIDDALGRAYADHLVEVTLRGISKQ